MPGTAGVYRGRLPQRAPASGLRLRAFWRLFLEDMTGQFDPVSGCVTRGALRAGRQRSAATMAAA